jgi:hypothetical protein
MLKIHDLNPDNIKVVIAWDSMVIGASVFVPCINTEAAFNQLKKISLNKGWECIIKVTIEGGKLGVRYWRTL